MSRHHILPPIVYTPLPPKPKKIETRRGAERIRKSGTSSAKSTDESGDIAEFDVDAPVTGHAAHDPFAQVDGAERKPSSTPGPLSAGTLKTMLDAQEQENAKADRASEQNAKA
jgi:hypothetical protein